MISESSNGNMSTHKKQLNYASPDEGMHNHLIFLSKLLKIINFYVWNFLEIRSIIFFFITSLNHYFYHNFLKSHISIITF